MKTPTLISDPSFERTRQLHFALLGFLVLFLLPLRLNAATIIWTGASGTDTNWSTAANWNGGLPGSGDDVKFFAVGAAADTNTINNFMDAGFAGTVASLQYANSNYVTTPT